MAKKKPGAAAGKLKIGDDWNAITIIALSQSNPLKAVAEFVENSIDARARNIRIIRGKRRGSQYLQISDDGGGIIRDESGVPDFKYVATHICDSIKRRLKKEGMTWIQGEYGIGLLSFWTVGKRLELSSSGADGRTYVMTMEREKPSYEVSRRRSLLAEGGTELIIYPLLPGIRQLTGEKIQRYLASELRDRIRDSGVEITVVDRAARAEYRVKPREFSGRLIHELPAVQIPEGEIYMELYLNEPQPDNSVSLCRSGTRVLASLTDLDDFRKDPWVSGYLQGIVDAPFLNLTPGTRSGIVHDRRFNAFCEAMKQSEERLGEIIEAQRRADEERASRHVLQTIQKALREAFLALPEEDYDWFDIRRDGAGSAKRSGTRPVPADMPEGAGEARGDEAEETGGQKRFFEFAGPLHNVVVSPASAVVPVGKTKNFRAVSRDRSRRSVEEGLTFMWTIREGEGRLENGEGEIVAFTAPDEPGITRLEVEVRQEDITCAAESIITVSQYLVPKPSESASSQKGLPGYTFKSAPGENWRSRYDEHANLVIINKGHRDFLFASRFKARRLRYFCRLFAKELVLRNFPGITGEQLLERMVELSLFTEENLK